MKNQDDPGAAGNRNDETYVAFVDSFREQFLVNIASGEERLFTTDVDPDLLWGAYLNAFPNDTERQHHNCHACRHFIQQHGGLVTIDQRGRTTPAMFHAQDSVFKLLSQYVARAKVTGVFFPPQLVLGVPLTGAWRHLSVIIPQSMLYSRAVLTNEQAMAEKKEDFKNVCRALDEYPSGLVEQALTILNADVLYRSEKVIGPAQFLFDLHVFRDRAVNKANITWKMVAGAPAGFCHPRSSMIGTLLEDLKSGLQLDYVIAAFARKMHPLQYQRPTAPPKNQTIDRAEEVVNALGIHSALRRRFAIHEEVEAVWRPALPQANFGQGVFHHLREEVRPHPRQVLPAVPGITWEKFARDVLPGAVEIAYLPKRYKDNYGVILTAADPEAPPILQWDRPERRNPFSSYVWHGGSTPSQFGLRLGEWQTVTAITLKPSMWYGADLDHQGKAVFFLLHGARETRIAGAALFPENLRSELHGVRSVIEAHSKSSTIEGREYGSAVGIMLHAGIEWDYLFRVKYRSNVVQDYKLDRWD